MPHVNFGVVGGSGAPIRQEASGQFDTITITLDSATTLTGVPAGELPAGTLVAPDSGTPNGKYVVVDTVLLGAATQVAEEIVILPRNVYSLPDGDQQVEAIIKGIWSENFYLDNGPLGAADKALFDQRIVLRWDGK